MDYNTLSIASLGPSTLSNSKNRPQIHYIRQSSDLIRDENTSEKKIITHITNDISDIDGARPKTTKERNYVSKSLFVDDIDGAKARFKDRFLQTKRHVNPLVPEYSLPSAQVAPSESQPFRRDNLMIDDIEGTRTSHRKIFPGRDPLQIDDIDGTRPGWKPRHLRIRKEADPHDIFPVTENPIKKTIWRTTTRETDPLNPSYRIHNTTYATVEKSSPKKLPLYIPDNHLLMTSDIEGAQAGYLMEHNLSIPNSMRTEFRNSNFLGDIEGAQADTRKKTIQTKRCSNPLQPVYKSLDGDDLISGPVDSLVPATLIDTNTVKFKSYGVIPQNNQWNSSTQSKESLTQSKSNHHHHHHNHNSSNNVHNNNNNSNNNSRKPSAQILTIDQHTDDSNDIKFTYSFDTNQSTTSQYLYPSSSQQNERIDLENLKSYADKLNNDLLISSSSSSSASLELSLSRSSSSNISPPSTSFSSLASSTP
mmetsp:Transcript_22436/g.23112  ORF Transcript_22436/g.23112 Transcript_22436/m.23112 type:complete len:477 (+) Transcript_22436:78-1508(+)